MISRQTKDDVLEAISLGQSHRDIAATFGISVGSVSKIKNEKPSPPSDEHPRPNLGELPQKRKSSLDILKKAVSRTSGRDKTQDYQRISIDTDKPIAIIKASDLHFGGLDVDYKSMLAHCKFLFDTPNFYLQLFGDDINMMVSHRAVGARHEAFSAEEQVDWLDNFVADLLERGKLLSMASGNHSDEFTERTAGFGIVRSLMKYKVPYFRGLGYIDLTVGDANYPMAFVHKTRFNSYMNPLHGNKRMEQMHQHYFGVDRKLAREYITAHTHNPAFSTEGCLPDQRIHYIKCGTFKTDCMFSQRYFGQGRIGVPTVVYHPDRLEHIVFPTPWEAYRYMNGKEYYK